MRWFKFLSVDPVNLTLKSKIYALIACFCAIFFIALITHVFALGPEYPLIVASMGASAVILFFIPGSPLAQPWPFVGGQIGSAIIGMTCALYIEEMASAAAMAVGGSILVMLLFRCLHPPGAATSLAPIMAGSSLTGIGYEFVLQPVGINVFIMLLLSLIINRWIFKLDYPTPINTEEPTEHSSLITPLGGQSSTINEQDIEQALKSLDIFVDMSHKDLTHLLNQIELNAFKRIKKDLFCQDIMTSQINTVEFGTSIEQAWQIMYQHKLKAMPVVDRNQRLIGIVTRHDFFKNLDLHPYESFQDQFKNFIRRTTGLTSTKPEAIGQIMSTNITALFDHDHIIKLIPLMSTIGHSQIPIINQNHQIVGIVFQSNLIAALYHFIITQSQQT